VTDWRLYADGVELEMDQHVRAHSTSTAMSAARPAWPVSGGASK
jgi:hypothetical protein